MRFLHKRSMLPMHPRVTAKCRLGEGPLYDPRRGALVWLDILARKLWRLDLNTGASGALDLDAQISAMALRPGGGYAAVAREGAGVLDPDTGRFDLRAPAVWDVERLRSNDGHAGPDGAFWFGVMDNEGAAGAGALYRLTPDWRFEVVVEAWGIPNTMLWSADGATLFAADSAIGAMETFTRTNIGLAHHRRLYAAPAESWTPDGSALDAEGCLWTARWDGGCVVRHAPDGRELRRMDLPVSRPTSCAFGGEGLATLFITSARDGVDHEPFAGDVFAVDAGVTGAPVFIFGG